MFPQTLGKKKFDPKESEHVSSDVRIWDSSQVEEEPDCDVYDDRITPKQWQELFSESDDEEEFHGFWSHQIWEKKWPMLHSFEISFRVK